MANNIPPPGLRGIYTLLDPFKAKLLDKVAYTCVSTRGINELINSGIDVFSVYYQPNNIPQEKYNDDIINGMMIVTFQAGAGVWLDVPSTYIDGLPDLNGIPYSPLVVALRLGAVADSSDLSYLQSRLEGVVKEELGIVVTSELVLVGQQTLVSDADHKLVEASRDVNKADADTDYSKYLAEKTRADALALKVTQLEDYIKSKGL